ncbi:MAG: LysM peptidoglycan-binding domain-containing protein, partial [Deinococcus-Thermus bacterium]|nr:LysM peptidoglycan-binding domain-containing protein [Deinococcota bacterium]
MRAAPRMRARRHAAAAAAGLAALAGCSDFDMDLRGPGIDTSEAALSATADRPQPDDRGIISYPGYQVAVARRGDTVADVAARVGLPTAELARFNGAPADADLNAGEVLALPRRVAEPSPATGAPATGPIRPSGEVDVTELAGAAIDRAQDEETIRREGRTGETPTGREPIRHKVRPGETAYTIARRYSVPVSALADWNGLDGEYTLRPGQFLLIPPAARTAAAAPAPRPAEPTAPGAGSPTPTPPSAVEPLPEDTAAAASAPDEDGSDDGAGTARSGEDGNAA